MGRWEEARERAMSLFADDSPVNVNCAQPVVAFAAHGLDQDERAMVVARYFGGGGVGMGRLCGAMSGVLISVGLRDYFAHKEDPAAPPETKSALQQLLRDFEAEFGSVQCRMLTGHDMRTKEEYQIFRTDPVSKRCADYVAWACDKLRPMLESAAGQPLSTRSLYVAGTRTSMPGWARGMRGDERRIQGGVVGWIDHDHGEAGT